MNENFKTQVAESVESVSSRWKGTPRFGIVLGTGAGIVAEHIQAQATLPYGSIANFPVSTATGHKGNLVCGTLDGHEVVAMQGRFHLYEGYDVDHATLPIHVMHALGVEVLFVSNAAGGLNPKMDSGDVMLIESHVDFMNRTSPQIAAEPTLGRPSFRSDQVYDRDLIESAHSIARKEGFALHQGVYAAMLGPNYETRAEYRMLRRMGIDVAGMSTVPEVNVAARSGIRTMAMSIVTNVANPDSLEPTSGEEVIEAARVAAPKLKAIVSGVMASC
ncbi:purine-nucleoside phosphorylase [Mariniblastus fucicola]|uniref:Purine nucleoside phosphorylase n=1 Tax=Mariniblastus fucicola TaxID=980251 RepID=A0A5B9PP20_9BACT|nr:purine-nucleoside phosphorylase [Mariniblastus fucicola]QEG24003.1 Purine nucleoside phosphorylase 1 [Mariniblastus fucicola]